ncbi:hypothetical protein BDZ89DRAFT_925688, partial [Hymenopellis radicata]
DYIFIGGGNAGLVAAVRVAQLCPTHSVLVLEAGKDVSTNPDIRIPGSRFVPPNLGNPEVDWSFFSAPQTNADGRSVSLPR